MPDIQWMNLDPVKLMEELSQFTSLEGFREMLDKAQVRHINPHSQIYRIKGFLVQTHSSLVASIFSFPTMKLLEHFIP